MRTNAIDMQDQNPPKNPLYNTFVHPPMIEHKDLTQNQTNIPLDTVVEVHLVTTIKNIIDNDLFLELATTTIEQLLLRTIPDLAMTTTTVILVPTVHHIDLPIDHPTNAIHTPVIDLDHTQGTTTFHAILLLIDHHLDLEILDILGPAHTLRHETK